MGLSAEETALKRMLADGDNLDVASGKTGSSTTQAFLQNIKNNPVFKAQFDLRANVNYFKNGASIAYAALDASLKIVVPIFIFGNSDFAGAFAKGQATLPTGWGTPTINTIGFQGSLSPNVKLGDIILQYQKVIGADTYACEVILSCDQVAYSTLLDSISSDRFVLNNIRYTVPTGSETQFSQQIVLLRQSLFGTTNNNYVSPQAYLTPGQYQPNIVDVPLNIGVDKNLLISTYFQPGVTSFTWTVFVATIQKLLSAKV